MDFYHRPVLLNECITYLNIKEDGIYVDATLGGGGHSREILTHLGEKGHLIGIDQDEDAIKSASETLKNLKSPAEITIIKSNFEKIEGILKDLSISQVDGILFDLGVSSHQFDEGDRGFSYRSEALLDMRMDQSLELSAGDIVNNYTQKELAGILWKYGEEKWAARIAQFIVEERKGKPVETTLELSDIIKKAIPKGARRDGPHPARRTFQALRIEVNRELEVLKKAIEDGAAMLKPGGRLLAISFHSLEDRIVKNTFRNLNNPCTCPPDFPICVCKKRPVVKIVTGRPIVASKGELDDNPRARSAKLRVCERIGGDNNVN